MVMQIKLLVSVCVCGRPQLTSNNSRQRVKKTVTNFRTWPGCFNGRFERSRNALSYTEVPLRQNAIHSNHYLQINSENQDKKTYVLRSTSQLFSSTEKVSFPFFLLLALISPAHEVLQFTYI